jgi:hypothetical protein
MTGWVPQWHIFLPGSERKVTVPQSLVALLHEKFPDSPLGMFVNTAREPRFTYDKWTYEDILYLPKYSSFTSDGYWVFP